MNTFKDIIKRNKDGIPVGVNDLNEANISQIKIENLSFQYSLSDSCSLHGIDLEINEGEYIVLCGKSGCGKTTLLKRLKPAVSPKGKQEGKIYFCSTDINTVDFQSPKKSVL